jgi:hypothetical protein
VFSDKRLRCPKEHSGPYIVFKISALAGVFSIEDADFVGSEENDDLDGLGDRLNSPAQRSAV